MSYNAGSSVTIIGDTTKGADLTGASVTVGGKSVTLTSSSSANLSFVFPALTAGNY